MKRKLVLTIVLALAAPLAWSAGNSYADMQRKEQQRLEQSRRDHAQRQQDNARANREYQQRMANYQKPQGARSSSSDKPGRMLDINDIGTTRRR